MSHRTAGRSWVVVGGGAAGCVVASVLSDHPGNDVLLLESGPEHGSLVDATGDRGPLLDDPARRRTDAVVTRRHGQSPVAYPQGHGLGGSSLINGGVVTGPGPTGQLPVESPVDPGRLGRAVLDAEPASAMVGLVRSGGRRVTAADAYLAPVRDRPNLTVRTDTEVRRLVVDGRRVVGVVTRDGTEHPADQVVMCAGAIQTPTLLLRSGIDTPGVGVGVQDHPAVTVTIDLAPGTGAPVRPREDTIAVAITRAASQTMVLNHLPGPASGRYGALMVAPLEVSSGGRVWLPDRDGPPHVELHQFDDPRDLDRLTRAAAQLLALVRRPAILALASAIHVDERGTTLAGLGNDPDAVRDWVFAEAGGYHHVASSCRIGVVSDQRGCVHGYRGLAIADASSFPTIPPVDPYVSVVLLAERLASGWRDSPPG